MTKRVEFLKNAILGKQIGAVARSSKYVIKAVLKNLQKISLGSIVEYGSGDGVLTLELLKLLSANGKMLIVEMDDNFVNILKKINDPRLKVVQGKMQDVAESLDQYGFTEVDLVLSSVPFSLINKKERDDVVRLTHDSLTQTGRFIIFHQYSKIMERPLKKYFKKISTSFEPRNILPCFIMCADKRL